MLFDFPYHTVEGENPESGFRAQLGGSYTFTSPPTDPDQRKFKLEFAAMQYFLNEDSEVDPSILPQRNMKALLDFYYEHKLHKTFEYVHPVHGMLEVKFNKPCPEPRGLPGGTGVVKSFEVELIEVP